MDTNTPLAQRLYYRCNDCLAMTCIEKTGAPSADCGICGGRMTCLGEVHNDHYEKRVEVCDCNEACQSARGPKCTCRCGAVNHGVGYRAHVVVVADGRIQITPEGDHDKHLAIAAEFLAAYDAAKARLENKYGENLDKVRRGEWVANKSIWLGIHNDRKALVSARSGAMQKNRLKKLAAIAI